MLLAKLKILNYLYIYLYMYIMCMYKYMYIHKLITLIVIATWPGLPVFCVFTATEAYPT